jgi:hypothetical protein
MYRPLLLATVGLSSVLALSACNRSDEGTTVSINADGGNVLGAINGETGEMKIDVPGFQGSVKLPKIQIGRFRPERRAALSRIVDQELEHRR